jgi:hypothetical protein
MTVLSHRMGHMRPITCWSLGLGLLSLCHLGPLPHSLGAEELSPERLVVAALCQAIPSRCSHGAAQTTADDLWPLAGPLLQPAASAPPEDPLASDCRYIGFQTEWVASQRDVGRPLSEALSSSRRVFARDRAWHDALAGALGTLVYRAPQRAPAELRQAMEAACLAHPLRWAEPLADW